MTRKQRAYVFAAIDVTLIPAALLFTYTVQALPQSAFQTLIQALPVLPSLVPIALALSFWLGLPYIQLKAYEGHAVRLTAILAVGLAGAAALLSGFAALSQPPGTSLKISAHSSESKTRRNSTSLVALSGQRMIQVMLAAAGPSVHSVSIHTGSGTVVQKPTRSIWSTSHGRAFVRAHTL